MAMTEDWRRLGRVLVLSWLAMLLVALRVGWGRWSIELLALAAFLGWLGMRWVR